MPIGQGNNAMTDSTRRLKDKVAWPHEYRRIDLMCWRIALAIARVTVGILISLLFIWVGTMLLDVRFHIELDSPSGTTSASMLTELDGAAFMNWVGQCFRLPTPRTITPNDPLGTLSGFLVFIVFAIGGPLGVLGIRAAVERVKDDLPGRFRLKAIVVDMTYGKENKQRRPREPSDKKWADAEQELRRSCYCAHVSGVEEGFLDDSDMSSGYCLAIIYQGNARNFRVLASARFYSTGSDIETELQDAKCVDFSKKDWTKKKLRGKSFPHGIRDGKWCLVDRLANAEGLRTAESGTTVKIQTAVFGLLYRTILDHSPEATYFVGLARMGRNEQLLHRYVPLGLRILGVCDYRIGKWSKSHWVLGSTREDLQEFARLQSVALRFIWRQKG